MSLKKSVITFLLTLVFIISPSCAEKERNFYVDQVKGDDMNPGSLSDPFKTLDEALHTVAERARSGIKSDKIFLRGGVYRKESAKTLYNLNLKGTEDDYSLISAMPCDSATPGAVKRKSGKWYERVIFDDARIINTIWVRDTVHPGIWKTNPGYTNLEWIHSNLWPWSRSKAGYTITPGDSTPNTTSFTLGPYMLLQDNEPFTWRDSLENLSSPGFHTYDHTTGTLYLYPFNGKDPNKSIIESWYGGPEEYDEGILYLDGEGRAVFKGNLEYAGIVGCEFRMVARLFEFQRRGYKKEEEREIQCHVLIDDNVFEYGWIHFLLDANTIYSPDDERIKPRFNDRSYWIVKNNVFFRPSREVFQVHGANHLLELNEVIDHIGPWAGPAACVGITNPRNMKNYTVRNNFIAGNGNTRYSAGSFMVVEVNGGLHADDNGDYINGPVLIENNLITDFTKGVVFLLGKGNVRLNDITIRNNIIGSCLSDPVLSIGNSLKNLIVENNLFYRNNRIFSVSGKGNPMISPGLPTRVVIRKNIFAENRSLIDERLFNASKGSEFMIDSNLFINNEERPVGTNPLSMRVEFMNPENYDFRIKSGNADEIYRLGTGPYKSNDSVPQINKWWLINKSGKNQ